VSIEQQKPVSTESTERPLRYRLHRQIRNIAMGVIIALARAMERLALVRAAKIYSVFCWRAPTFASAT